MMGAAGAAAIAIVVGTLVLVAIYDRHRVALAAAGAGLVLVSGLVPLGALPPTGSSGQGGILQWNTLALLFGLFVVATLLSVLGFFRWAGSSIARRAHGRPVPMFLGLVGIAFALSALLDSIVVMLILAAVTLEACRALGRDPIPLVIAEISAANLGGAATLIGDPPNLILGTYFHLSFSDFLVHTGLPALAALGVAILLFSRGRGDDPSTQVPRPPPAVPLARGPVLVTLSAFGVLLGVLAFQGPLGIPVWAVGLAMAALGMGLAGPRYLRLLLGKVDFRTLVFFLFLFLLVGSLETTGVIDSLAHAVQQVGPSNLLLTGTLLLWTFGLLSSVVNSVPLAAAAAPLIGRLSAATGLSASSLVYAVALGNDIGGNGTPIGASANLVGLGVARESGTPISWRTFVRRSFPIMLACLATANLVWWFVH